MKTAVLFLIFNRPKETLDSFQTTRNAKPRKLYITADGPRKSVEGSINFIFTQCYRKYRLGM